MGILIMLDNNIYFYLIFWVKSVIIVARTLCEEHNRYAILVSGYIWSLKHTMRIITQNKG